MLQELNNVTALVSLPSDFGNWGFMADHFGNSEMSESVMGFAYSRKLGEFIGVGMQFNYFFRNIPGYKTAAFISGELGLLFKVSDQVSTGLQVSHPTGVLSGSTGEGLPAVYSGGIGYTPSEKVLLAADIQKMQEGPVQFHAGFQYWFFDTMNIMGGVTPTSSSWYMGAGFKSHSFFITASAGLHPFLGITPGIVIMFKGK
jgi:hypothetical protein